LVVVQPALGQRQQPVPAGIFQRGDARVFAPEHHDLLAAHGAGQQRGLDLDVVSGGIPSIQRESGHDHAMNTRCIQKYDSYLLKVPIVYG
jgi:hypothetical protein